MTDNEYTPQQLLKVATYQRNLILLIVITLFLGFLRLPLGNLGTIINLAFNTTLIFFVYKLGVAIRSSDAWAYMILMLIPFVNILALLHLNSKAIKILKDNKLSVGFIGVSSSDIQKLKARIS